MWLTRRTRGEVRRERMSSCYLVPALVLLTIIDVHTFAPMVPTLVVIGCVTSLVFCLQGDNTPRMVLVSIVGHLALYLPYYYKGGLPKVPIYPSVILLSGILFLYMTLDVWPYPVTPVEFAVLGGAAMALFVP